MNNSRKYAVSPDDSVRFRNKCSFCVGTGRMGLALQKEYLDQLALTQKEIGFEYIRGHGLFCDDMAIYQEYRNENGETMVEYNFTYFDRVVDSYLALGIRPFMELGFTPEALASGTQTIFYWKGNTTPPKDYTKWAVLVKALITHVVSRYGQREALAWPVEVWNEPNLSGFWLNADFQEYLKLYEVTVRAVKEVLPDMRVGGPAICGGDTANTWTRNFLAFCRDSGTPIDFFSRHAYMALTPEHKGRYTYHGMRTVQSILSEMAETREIIDSFPEFRGMEMHVTEFNTSYNPRCPIHDTNLNAALTAGLLAGLGDTSASYSYWTFGDVFEESGVPFTPFHGGFGLVANGLIPKPTFWTFAFFKRLQGKSVLRTEEAVIVKTETGGYRGVCWNACEEKRAPLELAFEFSVAEGEHVLLTKLADEETCNPRKAWHDMGEPSHPSADQVDFIRGCAQPRCASSVVPAMAGKTEISFMLKENAVLLFELMSVARERDRGFDYKQYIT